MELRETIPLYGKNVKVICTDGETYEGEYELYYSAFDLEDESEAIVVKELGLLGCGVEIPVAEIASIEEVSMP